MLSSGPKLLASVLLSGPYVANPNVLPRHKTHIARKGIGLANSLGPTSTGTARFFCAVSFFFFLPPGKSTTTIWEYLVSPAKI
jgi:hypothetical protein